MISIYICADNLEELNFLKDIIEKYIFIEGLDFQIAYAFNTPQEILSALPRSPQGAVFFLDIDLKNKMNGIELAEKIRIYDPRAFIIFTTTHEEMAMTTFQYKIEALDYIMKDVPDYTLRIQQCIDNVLAKSQHSSSSCGTKICFSLPEKKLFLSPEDILYLEADGPRRITVHTRDSIFQYNAYLKEAAKQLNSFLYCHRAVLVNPSHIRSLQKSPGRVILDNGSSCVCSFRQFQKLKLYLEQQQEK